MLGSRVRVFCIFPGKLLCYYLFSKTRLAIISTTEQENSGRDRAYLDISYNNSFTFLVEVVSTCSLTTGVSWRG